jgi:hypothetical protein
MPEMNKKQPARRHLAAWAIIALGCSQLAVVHAARADDGIDASLPLWSFGGFGSVGVVHSDQREADFSTHVLKASGAGFSRPWSLDVDSRLGAQLDVKLDAQWSAVVQVISQQSVDNSYAPIVEWANIKYQITPDLSVRVGRIALPLLLAADYRTAAYAFPWVRPPVELYGAFPISHSDGVDISYRSDIGSAKNTLQASYGKTHVKLGDGQSAEGRALIGISNTLDYDALSIRASLLSADLTTDAAAALFARLRQSGAQGIALADRYDGDHKRVHVIGIGANYDPGDWFLMGELGRMRTRSFLGDRTALYVSAGYRFGNLTPYLTYAQSRASSNRSDPGLSLAGLPPAALGTAAMLNTGLNRLLGSAAIQHSASAGARWDVAPNIALKLQYDRVRPQSGSSGMLINVQPGFRSGVAVNVVSAVLDFVY